MVGTNLKAETMKLMDERANTEAEMDVIIQRLCQPGGPGLSGNLVDSEVIFSFFCNFRFYVEFLDVKSVFVLKGSCGGTRKLYLCNL